MTVIGDGSVTVWYPMEASVPLVLSVLVARLEPV